MKKIVSQVMVTVFVAVSLVLGWGVIFKALNGVQGLGCYSPQGYYQLLSHM